MLVNRNRWILMLFCFFSMVYACKEKKVAQATEPYKPTRSDYIIAVNQAFLTASDSAANRTRDAILNNSDKVAIKLDLKNQAYIDLFKSLGDSVKEEIIYTQLRAIAANSVDDLHIYCSNYLKLSKNDDLKNLLQRTVITRNFIFMKQFDLAKEIEQKCKKEFAGSRSDVFLREGKMLYEQYYNTKDSTVVSFANIARSTALFFINEMEKQEKIAKENYRLWNNKQAIDVMNYLEKN